MQLFPEPQRLFEAAQREKKLLASLRFSRRQFSFLLGGGLLGLTAGCQPNNPQPKAQFEDQLADLFGTMPGGMSAAAVRGEKLIWSGGVGFADVDEGLAMTSDHIQNIASVSKIVTATAIMQLWEKGAFKLDDDINTHLPFNVRNPQFADEPITFRQLLAHRSSIKDGPSYDESYACGDPEVSLATWIRGYFSQGGSYNDPKTSFHSWRPGTSNPPESPRAYSNVAYGLLGFLVEQITGKLFSDYCQEYIFRPLKMNHTGWHLSAIDQGQHAKLYSGFDETSDELYLAEGGLKKSDLTGNLYPHCLYSFYNYPDGLLRTNVKDLSRFQRAYINEGMLEGERILAKETVNLMLSNTHFGRGLCWDTYGDEENWGHDGGDPGVATFMGFTTAEKIGVIVFFNAGDFGDKMNEIVSLLYKIARTE